MSNFTPYSALLGGALIGASATLLLLTHGRVAGISGIVGGLGRRAAPGWAMRVAFVAGLVVVGVVARGLAPASFGAASRGGVVTVAVAGLLVGFGTRLGGGCTSGHGVCGLSRGSWRSLVATMLFMAAAVATVAATRLVGAAR